MGSSSRLVLPPGVLLGGILALASCSVQYIPNTDVEDTSQNRAIVAFCEKYRKAVERQDIATLLEMAAPEYYEDGGNVDASDDIDYAGLKEYLLGKFGDASAIRYEVRYRRVLDHGDRVYVDYTYSGSFQLLAADAGAGDGEQKWRHTVEENRLELASVGESFKILAGM
ncbi:MAG: hypothetical protein HY744_14655 [Deltaproteobacteria bacterium]|nr:hypothetical protein [Deltaproteobacteria bacterium]